MAINFNTGPYFDDFDPKKNFYKVLYKAGTAVQARELNQVQSILQHQISSVGNHLFKKNAMVIPGGIALNTSADIIRITLIDGGNITNISELVGKTITNISNFDPLDDSTLDGSITAVVLAYRDATTTEPAALYVKYFKTQTDGRKTFNKSEDLYTVDSTLVAHFKVDSSSDPTIGKVAILKAGTFYTKEIFVDAAQQILIVEIDNTTVTNCTIGLNIVESIVTSDTDDSLLDNSLGYPNQYAPGADRYKVELILTRIDSGTLINDDKFIRMMDIENNTITYLNNKTEYAELMKTLARRTYDANGNFIVNGFETSVVDSPDDADGNPYVTVNVTRGKCYLGGYEYERLVNTPIYIDKPRGTAFQQEAPQVSTYKSGMPYFYVAGGSFLKEIPAPDSLVQFLDIISPNVLTFDGSDTNIVTFADDTIKIPNHYLKTGDEIVYSNGGGTDIGGLTSDNTYYVRAISDELIELYDTYDHAISTNTTYRSNLASGAAGTLHTITIKRQQITFNATTAQNLSADTITITAHNLITGNKVKYSNGGGTSIGGLTSGNDYYVIRVDANTIKLSSTYSGSAINLTTGAAGTGHKLIKVPSVIGYGIFKDIQYSSGTFNLNDVYKVFFDYISFEKGYSLSDVGSIIIPSKNEGMPILHEVRLSNTIGTFTAGNRIVPGSGTGESGLLYSASSTIAYVIKDKPDHIPTSDVVKDYTTGATASRRSTFTSSYTPSFIPMIEVDNSVIKTLKINNTNTTSYSIVRRDVITSIVAGERTIPDDAITSGQFEGFSSSNYFAFITDAGEEEFVDLSTYGVTPTLAGTKYTITIPADDKLIGKTVAIYSTIRKDNAAESTKTSSSATTVITTPSKSWMALKHQDVIRIDKIVEGKTVTVTNATWTSNVATITATYTIAEGGDEYNHTVGDVIVTRNVKSSSNTGGSYNSGFNGEFTLTDVGTSLSTTSGITTVTLTLKYALTPNPGTYTSSDIAIVCLTPNTSSDIVSPDIDVTSKYTLDSGNTAYLSSSGLIKLKKKSIPPQGQLGVKYTYYSVTDGNYQSVDSYETGTDLSYIGGIANVMDQLGNSIETRRYIDFRTRTSSYFFKNIGTIAAGSAILKLKDLNLSAFSGDLSGKYVVGPSHLDGVTIAASGIKYNATTGDTEITLSSNATSAFTGMYYIGLKDSTLTITDSSAGAISYPFPKENSQFSYKYVKFLPRQVLVMVHRDTDILTLSVEDVESLNAAYKLRRNENKLPLTYLYMEPYTVGINNVKPYKFENPVYQMLDIHNLKLRVDRNEYYASLALNRDIQEEIVLAGQEDLTTTALGFWNEDFMSPYDQDYQSPDFLCTVYDKSYAAPGTVIRTVNVQLDSTLNTSTWAQTGTALTLPYAETLALSNSFASRSNNLNPYNMIQWNGKIRLNPSVDNWIDLTLTSTTVVNTTVTSPPVVIPEPPVLPPVVTQPPVVLPQPPVEEIVIKVDVIKSSWGPDTLRGFHAITFNWETNLGRKGRVNTDTHLMNSTKIVQTLVTAGSSNTRTSTTNTSGSRSTLGPKQLYDGSYALSLINRRYNDSGVKEYLNIGAPFDTKPPSAWWR